jgi:alcohol dehydrogenase YqhD (iron-dependent ADH family)
MHQQTITRDISLFILVRQQHHFFNRLLAIPDFNVLRPTTTSVTVNKEQVNAGVAEVPSATVDAYLDKCTNLLEYENNQGIAPIVRVKASAASVTASTEANTAVTNKIIP